MLEMIEMRWYEMRLRSWTWGWEKVEDEMRVGLTMVKHKGEATQ
jgi:hypothetical protein